jgi:hypothetical protein
MEKEGERDRGYNIMESESKVYLRVVHTQPESSLIAARILFS